MTDKPTFAKAPEGDPSLGQTIRTFFSHPSPRTLTAGLLIALTVRLWLGGWTLWDPILALAMCAWQPINEWLIHKYLLHFRPRQIGRFTLDFELARRHRRHHLNPWDVPTLFIPMWTVVLALVLEPVLFFLLLPTVPLASSAVTMAVGIGLFYEWSHFLPHVGYRPTLTWWRNVVKYHRLHHFKNERYWMGVSSNLGDMVLGTFPQAREVPQSETVRDILARGDGSEQVAGS
jgi:hypothetical protein